MIIAINYADEKFRTAQKFNSRSARKAGADSVVEYTPPLLDDEFRERNKEILSCRRGAGYWIWKPYIILDALKKADDGDYIVYSDSGSAFVRRIKFLIDAMNEQKTDIMVFSLIFMERDWSKRDAFVLMDCDSAEFFDTQQRLATYVIMKKSDLSIRFTKDWLKYACDARIVTDMPNVMGKENYEGFRENRHDQTVLSLLSKKYGIPAFRDPSQGGNNCKLFPAEVLARSKYPQVIDSHRNPGLKHFYQLDYYCPAGRFFRRIIRLCRRILRPFVKPILIRLKIRSE